MKNFRQTLGQIYRLASPYFRGEEKWIALGLLALIVGIRLFNVWIDVRFNSWNNDFYNSLQNKDWPAFVHQLVAVFSVLAFLAIITGTYQSYFMQWLQIRWRAWMTGGYLGRWMNAGTHYRMRLLGNPADNPDQRIADDVQRFVGGGAGSGLLDIGVALLCSRSSSSYGASRRQRRSSSSARATTFPAISCGRPSSTRSSARR